MIRLVGVVVMLISALLAAHGAPARATFEDRFDGDLSRWQPLHAENWELRMVREDGLDNHILALRTAPPLRPGVRRPAETLLVRDRVWRDVTLDVRARSLRAATVVGRDVVLIFGYVDDLHFYYAHLSNDSNGSTHNVIMKVNGDDPDPAKQRVTIQAERRPEPRLTDGWHAMRVEHRADGAIRVFMDALDKPLMTAQDTTYPAGGVGLASFDDTAEFDDVRIVGEVVPAK
ncbi:MAG: hypothetical protein HZB16_12130 [Armatimonadetes bacterium]|nr:hypothetical protein [Armatimonadota bacterium]